MATYSDFPSFLASVDPISLHPDPGAPFPDITQIIWTPVSPFNYCLDDSPSSPSTEIGESFPSVVQYFENPGFDDLPERLSSSGCSLVLAGPVFRYSVSETEVSKELACWILFSDVLIVATLIECARRQEEPSESETSLSLPQSDILERGPRFRIVSVVDFALETPAVGDVSADRGFGVSFATGAHLCGEATYLRLQNETFCCLSRQDFEKWLSIIGRTVGKALCRSGARVSSVEEMDGVDCVRFCVGNPTIMLKSPSSRDFGSPKWARIAISMDGTKVLWGSCRQEEYRWEAKFVEVEGVVMGKTGFERERSFHLLYGDGQANLLDGSWSGKSLDMTCQTVRECRMWIKALTLLVEKHAAQRDVEFDIPVEECIQQCKARLGLSPLLKYAQDCEPALWRFAIDSSEDRLMWGFMPRFGRRDPVGMLRMEDVREIQVGQETRAFARDARPDLVSVSFSIVYGPGSRDEDGIWTGNSLDVICSTKKDFYIWTTALRHLISTRRSRWRLMTQRLSLPPFLGNSVRSWGDGEFGGLGNCTVDSCLGPEIRVGPLQRAIDFIALGNHCLVVMQSNGSLLACGRNDCGQLGVGSEEEFLLKYEDVCFGDESVIVRKCCLGAGFTLFLDRQGTVWGCGSNAYGCLTNATTEPQVCVPVRLPVDGYVRCLETGDHHCGVLVGDHVLTWGCGKFGELGHGRAEDSPTLIPTVVDALSDIRVWNLSFGQAHSLALTDQGDVFAWGDNSFGQLGFPLDSATSSGVVSTPVMIPSIHNIASVSAGHSHSGACSIDGKIYMWGDGHFGKLGNGGKVTSFVPVEVTSYMTYQPLLNSVDEIAPQALRTRPLREPLRGRCTQLVCGTNHTLALMKSYGEQGAPKTMVLAWGRGTHGSLGLLNELHAAVPQEVGLSEVRVWQLFASNQTSFCIAESRPRIESSSDECGICGIRFTTFRRRHTCRSCGQLFCRRCTSQRVVLVFGSDPEPMQQRDKAKVCDRCYPYYA